MYIHVHVHVSECVSMWVCEEGRKERMHMYLSGVVKGTQGR